jgi:signal transduction histidine kinase
MAAGVESKAISFIPRSGRIAAFAGVFAIAMAVAEIAVDFGTWVELDIAAIYGIPLVLAAFTRSRFLLWGLMIALTAATFAVYALQIPVGTFGMREALFVNRALDAAALLLTAGLLHVLMVSLDIREAQARMLQAQNRRLEAANDLLVTREAQIVRQNEELARRRNEAEEASNRKTRFLNAVSHDIRNPVNTINLMAELIRRAAEDPSVATQVPKMARRLQSNAQSLVALVSEMLDIAHLDAGVLQRNDTRFSLNEFVETKARELAPLAEEKSLRLDSGTPEQAIWVRTDRIKLDRIVTNLVINAIKFTAHGGVTVDCSVAADGVAVIRVQDTGCGIAAHEIAHIFEEFTQFDASPGRPGRGWGLGLPICRRLADFIGASIDVASTPGTGTAVTVRLPPECIVDVGSSEPSKAPSTITS